MPPLHAELEVLELLLRADDAHGLTAAVDDSVLPAESVGLAVHGGEFLLLEHAPTRAPAVDEGARRRFLRLVLRFGTALSGGDEAERNDREQQRTLPHARTSGT